MNQINKWLAKMGKLINGKFPKKEDEFKKYMEEYDKTNAVQLRILSFLAIIGLALAISVLFF